MARERKRPIEPLSAQEVENLLDAASSRSSAGIRNRALIAVLYFSGLRPCEALALRPADIDLERGQIHVGCANRPGHRLAALNAQARAHLALWMETRERLGVKAEQPLFCTFSMVDGERQIKPLSPRYVQLTCKRLARRAGIQKRVHPQGLRHSHAVHLLRRGVSLPAIQRQLGHARLATTDAYLRALAAGEHVESIRDLDW